MNRASLTGGIVAVVLGLVTAPVGAADSEVRTFGVTVDGKKAGTFKMAVRVEDDGTETIAAVADVKVAAGFLTYTYALQSLEVWKGDRLVSVEANANDDGKKTALRLTAAAGGLAVTVNGKTHPVPADVLTSTGWRPPAADRRARTLLDTEDGTLTPVRVDPPAAGQLTRDGKSVEARRVRVTGKDVDTVWWFDRTGRPVRQEMVWDGHKVVLDLSAIER